MFKKLLTIGILLQVSSLWATVDMKNANFTDEWIDFKLPTTGFELNVTRTYNSRTLHNGIFGFGWCSDYETKLEKEASGIIKIQYCGAGNVSLYYPSGFNTKKLKSFVSRIMSSHKKSGVRFAKAEEKRQFDILMNDPKRRAELAAKYKLNLPITPDTKYVSNNNSGDFIVIKGGKFIRTRPDQVKEIFGSKGLLMEKRDKNGNFQKFKYRNGLIAQVINQIGQQLNFVYYPNKKVKEIKGPSGLYAKYKYKKSDLVWVRNAWKNQYKYEVDSLHNITKISYPDKTTREITYDKDKDWVIGFKDREGCKETYKVEFNSSNPRGHYWTNLVKRCGKKITNRSKFEFWYKKNKKKGEYLSRVKTVINGKVKDITYHPTLFRPIKEIENGRTKVTSYFGNGLVKSRKEGGIVTKFKYIPKTRKISFVQRGKTKSHFKYDKKGNLTYAYNSKGQKVKLKYDRSGRIVSLVDHAKRVVKIKYNEKLGKPSIVERPGLGSILVRYDNSGNIKKVDSKAGPAVAVQVASAFNNLLEIVKPAGVELGL